MTNITLPQKLIASVQLSAAELAVTLHDRRPEVVALFDDYIHDTDRDQLALDAWAVGLRALANAHAAAHESKLKDIGANLLANIDTHFKRHVEDQQRTIGTVLGRFFDPADGQVSRRLTEFVADHGALARVLEKFLAPQNSVLADALNRQLGEASPLLKRLSPTDSTGVVKSIESVLQGVLEDSRAALEQTLDPLAENGAVARFLKSLRDELRQKQLTTALAALDANNENSLLSRLVRETHAARAEVVKAFNPSVPDSPIAVLEKAMTKLFHDHTGTQAELANRQEERQVQFEKEVREALSRMETKRALDLKAPRGGHDFEDAVLGFVRQATSGGPCVFAAVGDVAGLGRCKKGDAVVTFTAESAFEGATVVFEAKRDGSYNEARAIAELNEARKNRDASVGVFVMARSHAGDDFRPFVRHGNNVLVVWDENDPSTDPYLHAAITLGFCLVARIRAVRDAGDINALREVEQRIANEVARLSRIENACDTITKQASTIAEEVRKGHKDLGRLLADARNVLLALKLEISDEVAEAASPLHLPDGSLANAVLTLGAGD
jgi:hypothetical protein